MSKRGVAAFFLCAALMLWANVGRAQLGLELTPVTPATEVVPRQTMNLVLEVSNSGNEPWTGRLIPELPPDWRLLVPTADLSLAPGEASTQVITLLVPQYAEAGVYSVRVRDGESEEAEFLLTVEAVYALRVIALDAPQLAVAEDYSATFSILNSGNATTEILLLPEDNLDLQLETRVEGRPHDGSTGLVLRTGETVLVEVLVHVPPDLESLEKHRLTLRVQSRDAQEVAASANVRVDLIPNEANLSAAFHSFPLRLRAVAALDLDQIAGSPYEALEKGSVVIAGEGKLWDRQPGTLRVEMGTGTSNEERRALVAYRLDDFRFAVGRQKLRSTPLLPDLEGVGAQVFGQVWPEESVRLGGEAYLLADDNHRHYGAAGLLTLHEAFRGNVRLRVGEEETHFGTRWQVLPGPVSASDRGATRDLDVEYARRWTATGASGSAIRFGAGFEADPLEANVSFEARESGYDDASNDSTTVTAEAEGKLAIPFPDLFEVRMRLNVDYPAGSLLGGNRTIEGYESRFDLKLSGKLADADVEFGYVHEEAANYGASSYSSGKDEFSVSLATFPDPESQFRQRFGVAKEVNSTIPEPLHTYLYLAGLRTALRYGELTSELDLAYARKQRRFSRLVLSSEWSGEITPELDLFAGFDWALVGDRIVRLEAKAAYSPTSARQLEVGLRGDFYSSRPARLRLDLALSETFQLQLGPLSTVGRVSGRVTDGSGTPRQRLVIRLAGRSSVTDEEGWFLFPAVPEGTHMLSIHPESLARNELTVPATPLTLKVDAQSEVNQDLMLVQGARLRGNISYQVPATEGEAWERALPAEGPGPLDGIQLTLTNGQFRVQTLSDARGNFEFAQLIPGEWRLSVGSERLSDSYRFIPEEQILELKPGQNEVIIELQPKERAIRFMEGGVIEDESR